MKLLIIALFTLVSCSCHNTRSAQVMGGPCTYTIRTIPATVISVDSINAFYYSDIRFIAKGVEGHDGDIFYYSRLYGGYVSKEVIKSKNIHPRQTIPFRVENITKGTCNPLVTRLLLDSL